MVYPSTHNYEYLKRRLEYHVTESLNTDLCIKLVQKNIKVNLFKFYINICKKIKQPNLLYSLNSRFSKN